MGVRKRILRCVNTSSSCYIHNVWTYFEFLAGASLSKDALTWGVAGAKRSGWRQLSIVVAVGSSLTESRHGIRLFRSGNMLGSSFYDDCGSLDDFTILRDYGEYAKSNDSLWDECCDDSDCYWWSDSVCFCRSTQCGILLSLYIFFSFHNMEKLVKSFLHEEKNYAIGFACLQKIHSMF